MKRTSLFIFGPEQETMAQLESKFKANLREEIEQMFPGCYIFKTDRQGIPDMLIIWESKWAMLEVKRSATDPFQPNQEWYIAEFNSMSYAACIYPENKDQVLYELQQALRPRRAARVSIRK